MRPTLYAANETDFSKSGIGTLVDCLSCLVTEERNGQYVLDMEYPADGIWSDEIEVGCIIKAKANDVDRPQLFQINDVVRTLSGIYTVQAQHISYRLSGVPVLPFTAAGPAAVLAAIESHVVTPTGFTFSTDLASSTSYSIPYPRSVRALLGGEEGSLLDQFGGEYHFDNFEVQLLKARGANNGVEIRHGKNLTDLSQEINGGVYNGIFPFWYNEGEGAVYPDAAVTDGTPAVPCYEAMDLTTEFDSKPTKAQLTTMAQQLVSGMSLPIETLDVSFVSLAQVEEYATIATLEHVALCDTVTVIYPALNIRAKMKVVKTVFNTMTEMYDEITLGTLQTSLAEVIANSESSNGTISGDTPEDEWTTRTVKQADSVSVSAGGGYDVGFTAPSSTYTLNGVVYDLMSTCPINVQTGGTGTTYVIVSQTRPGGCYLRNVGSSAATVTVTAYYLYQKRRIQ